MKTLFTLFFFFLTPHLPAQNQTKTTQIKSTKGLIAFWDLKEAAGERRASVGPENLLLTETNGMLPRINEGPLSGYSALFGNGAYLSMAAAETGALNIFGKGKSITVIAWIKWTGEQTGFIGGMWNEYKDGGKRQYGLFVSLPYYNGRNQVCGH